MGMFTTDISRRWIDPVLVEVFTYGLPPVHAALDDSLVQGMVIVDFLEPVVVEAVDSVIGLDVDVYAYGAPHHINDVDTIVASLDDPLAQGVPTELLKPIVVESFCPMTIPEPSTTLATVDFTSSQVFVQPPPMGLPPTVSPALSNLTMVFVSSTFVAGVAAFALVLRGASQGGEGAVDIPSPNLQTEQGKTSVWVSSVETMVNSASVPSGDFPYNDIFHMLRECVRVQCTFEICQAEDSSVPRESVFTQDILSLYVRVPELRQIMFEEVDGVYDASDSIASAIRFVVSDDDLRTMASAISFPSVNDFAPPTEFLKLCQAVFDELVGRTQSMVPSLSLLSVADLGSIPFDLRSPKLCESTGGFERFDLNWSGLAREAWARDFRHRFLSDTDLVKLAYHTLLPADAPKTAGTGNVPEALILSGPRSSSAQLSNSGLRFSSENPSPGDLEDEQSFESSAIQRDVQTPHTPTPIISSLSPRPLNLVLQSSDPDSSIEDLEDEESIGSSAATPIRRRTSSPSRIPVACWRSRASVSSAQVTRSARTCGSSPSRIPIRSESVLRFRMDVPSSIVSRKPNRPKRCTPSRFPTVVPAVHLPEESGTPTRPARRCLACSQYSPRRSD